MGVILLSTNMLGIAQSKDFVDYKYNPSKENIGLFLKNSNNKPYASLNTLKEELTKNNKQILFAMNAGMYMENLMPLGLYIEDSKTIRKLNEAKNKYGNFYIEPNGVFFKTTNSFHIVSREKYQIISKNNISFATQSGPLLIIDGGINSNITKLTGSTTRNAACINDEKDLILTISTKSVTFSELANHLKNNLHCQNAIFLDGGISDYLDTNHNGLIRGLGPLIAIYK